jgi:hypothetical protein
MRAQFREEIRREAEKGAGKGKEGKIPHDDTN